MTTNCLAYKIALILGNIFSIGALVAFDSLFKIITKK